MQPWFNHETTGIYRSLSKWSIYYQTLVLFSLGGHIKTLKNSRRNTAYPRHRNYFEMDHGPYGKAKTVQLPEENEENVSMTSGVLTMKGQKEISDVMGMFLSWSG